MPFITRKATKKPITHYAYACTPQGVTQQLEDYFTYNMKEENGLKITHAGLFWFTTQVLWDVLNVKLGRYKLLMQQIQEIAAVVDKEDLTKPPFARQFKFFNIVVYQLYTEFKKRRPRGLKRKSVSF